MKNFFPFCGVLLLAVLACVPGSVATKDVNVIITTFVDESGKGILPETYPPLPNTLVIAKWNIHGGMFRQVELTDQNGHANFSVSYTHFSMSAWFLPVGITPPHRFFGI
jgi:hypothetical protein